MNKSRFRLDCKSQTEKDKLLAIQKSLRNDTDAVREACIKNNIDYSDVPDLWIKTKSESIRVKNPNYIKKEYKDFLVLRDELLKWVRSEAPKKYKPKRRKEGKCLHLIDPADVHIGKLCDAFETGQDYNSNIAVQRVYEGVDSLVRKASVFNVDEIMFVGGNDILHVDTPNNTTTNGTKQDVSENWYQSFLKAVKLYQEVLNNLAEEAPVRFVYNPSNHDYMSGFMLAQLLEAYFSRDSRISFDIDIKHRKYYRYHSNLIGTTHGDGAKKLLLPALMADEASVHWGLTKHRYFFAHHVHHADMKDHPGVTVRTLRSPSPPDSWHYKMGYVGAPQAIESFLFDKQHGQHAQFTHNF